MLVGVGTAPGASRVVNTDETWPEGAYAYDDLTIEDGATLTLDGGQARQLRKLEARKSVKNPKDGALRDRQIGK